MAAHELSRFDRFADYRDRFADRRPDSTPGATTDPVVVDCDRCVVRGPSACGDCVVTVLLGAPPAGVSIDADEQAALDVLADAGVVPPLRLVTPVTLDLPELPPSAG